ncbi:MAG: NAD-dependent epimerase/dehydratase family protein [Daejeonella sp.]
MKYLVTGASGFLGKIITQNLVGSDIFTLGRTVADIVSDLSKEVPLCPSVDCVIHTAGKAHMIPASESESKEFFDVNVIGTLNLLRGLEANVALPSSLIFISSVGVYGVESGLEIRESRPLTARDPYGRSKIEAEKLVRDWCKEHSVTCTILRLPLLAGPNPPGNLRSMINGINKGYYFNIGGGKARKSIVLAEDVANIIPIAQTVGGTFNLTDGYHPTFCELSALISSQLQKKTPRSLPFRIAWLVSILGDAMGEKFPLNSIKLKKIVSDLTFDDSKARSLLGWKPRSVLDHFFVK